MEFLFLAIGLTMLIASGHFLVIGSVSLARHFKVSTLVVGLTVVSFGTSAPELFVSVQAAFDHPSIALGNVVGSNISNIALVLAITAIIYPLQVKGKTVRFDWPVMMFVSLLFFFFIYNHLLARWEGVLLVLIMVGYLYWSFYSSRKKHEDKEDIPKPKFNLLVSILLIAVSCVGLLYGSDWLVNKGAVPIAEKLGISKRVIAITMIAVGTSLPELATSAIAAIKKEPDISVGNIIGSNIFNILAVLGITSIVNPIRPLTTEASQELNALTSFDIPSMLVISLILFFLILPLKGGMLYRWKGMILLAVYVAYILMLVNLKQI